MRATRLVDSNFPRSTLSRRRRNAFLLRGGRFYHLFGTDSRRPRG